MAQKKETSKLKTRRLRTVVGAVVFVGMAAALSPA